MFGTTLQFFYGLLTSGMVPVIALGTIVQTGSLKTSTLYVFIMYSETWLADLLKSFMDIVI